MGELVRGERMTGRATIRSVGTATVLAAMLALIGVPALAHASGGTVWLCKPGLKGNPCTTSRRATVVTYEGATREEAIQGSIKAAVPPVDCFYVYPTVSEQQTENANLEIEVTETQVAKAQASRFSQDCTVYAPMYPQITLHALHGGGVTKEAAIKAYLGVLGAWHEYISKYNKGRPFVLIGHSQGALLLEQLVKEQIDPNPALRGQLISAILLGGNVLVPEGQTVGGTFQSVPACQTVTQTRCVVAYSAFAKEPPANAYFGRPGSPLLEGGKAAPGTEVLCVNPTLAEQNGHAGQLMPYAPTTPLVGEAAKYVETPEARTPWVEELGLVTAQCKHENGASWLQVSPAEGLSADQIASRAAHHEGLSEKQPPEWGLHVDDVNAALGNLVGMVAIEIAHH